MNPETSTGRLKRVLIVCGGLKPVGGYQRRMACLAARLQERGVRTSVLIKGIIPRPNQHLEALRAAGVRVVEPGTWAERVASVLPGRLRTAFLWRVIHGLEMHWRLVMRLACAALRPQIVHVFRPDEVTAPSILTAREGGIPVAYSETGEVRPDLAWYPKEVVEAVAAADMILVTSSQMARNARMVYGAAARIRAFPPMLPALAAAPERAPDGVVRMTYAGRLSPEKNPDGLLQALALLGPDAPAWRLRFAGDGPSMETCGKLAQTLGLTGRVEFTGSYDVARDFARIAGETDLFVLPSHTEGYALVLIEAAASGRPILATPVGGADEMVTEGETGFRAESSAPEALAEALRRALAAREQLGKLGRAARQRYETRFAPERILADMLEGYQRLLRRERPDVAAEPGPGPDISFVVVNYNMRALVEECVQHVSEHRKGGALSAEILVGDNSTDPAFALDEAACARLGARFHRIERSHGWVDALNALLPQARGRFVFIMHPDIELAPGCVEQCAAYLRAHPEVGVVAPNPYKSDGEPARARLRFPSLAFEGKRLANLLMYLAARRRPLREEPVWDRSADTEADSVLSFGFMCRRELLQAMGQIGGSLSSYYANDTICMTARKLGYRVMYLKEPRLIHYERRTPRHLYGGAEAMRYKASAAVGSPGMQRDRLRFIDTFYPAPVSRLFRALTAAEFALHSAVALVKSGPDRRQHVAAYLRVLRHAMEP